MFKLFRLRDFIPDFPLQRRRALREDFCGEAAGARREPVSSLGFLDLADEGRKGLFHTKKRPREGAASLCEEFYLAVRKLMNHAMLGRATRSMRTAPQSGTMRNALCESTP